MVVGSSPTAATILDSSSAGFSRRISNKAILSGWQERNNGSNPMAKNEKRTHVTLACEDCKRRNYITTKNKVNDRDRIEMMKYCRWDRRHTVHKETR